MSSECSDVRILRLVPRRDRTGGADGQCVRPVAGFARSVGSVAVPSMEPGSLSQKAFQFFQEPAEGGFVLQDQVILALQRHESGARNACG